MFQSTKTKSRFPPPPLFYKFYTNEAKEKHFSKKFDQNTSMTDDQQKIRTLNVIDEINIFSPPPIPSAPFYIFQQLNSNNFYNHQLPQGIPKLYAESGVKIKLTAIDYCAELKKLNDHILTTFLNILEQLIIVKPIEQTSSANDANDQNELDKKCQYLSHIFINMTHLITLMRKHQSYQMVIQLLNEQIQKRKDQLNLMNEKCENIQKFLIQNNYHFDGPSTILYSRRSELNNSTKLKIDSAIFDSPISFNTKLINLRNELNGLK